MMDSALKNAARTLIRLALAEDIGERGDITTHAVGHQRGKRKAKIIAKDEGILCGMEMARLVLGELHAEADVHPHASDGDHISKKQLVCEIAGDGSAILTAERTILNFMGRLSGIASLTGAFVKAVEGTRAKILDTRKTTPGWRLLEKYAVRCGGGVNHRTGLFDMFLIKENHIAQAGGIADAVRACRRLMQQQHFNALIEVEVKSISEAKDAVELAVDRIMLDNMTLEQMRECVQLVCGKIPLEASGNMNLRRVRAVAETGVDFISVGALTHSAPVFDFSLLLES